MNLRIKKKKEKQKLEELWEAALGPEPQLLPHEHRSKDSNTKEIPSDL